MSSVIGRLVDYAVQRNLIEPEDRIWATNQVLQALGLTSYKNIEDPAESAVSDAELPALLDALVDDAAKRGVIETDSVVHRDLLDTAIMGALTPPPREVRAKFAELVSVDPSAATDWFYQFSKDTNYIRRDRMEKDRHWVVQTRYGDLDISINLAKPEKDPRAIAQARDLPQSDYPTCLLCATNEGYAGRVDHPARQNHRVAPVEVEGQPWFLQYSPYVYYNEHCIVFSAQHTPMKIDRALFAKLLDFVEQFPHYFVGSNADLPIVGGSILAHDHFQGGNFTFAMERAPLETEIRFDEFPTVSAGIVDWPMSVIRIRSKSKQELVDLANKILGVWRGYSDEDHFIFAQTNGEPHNTITPIARRRGPDYELDLVLRNNITTEEHPLGVFHPHAELHHIKKENIGLIEVMGLAVLPARLEEEIGALTTAILNGEDLRANPLTAKHADWAEDFAGEITSAAKATPDEAPAVARAVIAQKIGEVFAAVLEHAGVYKKNPDGKSGFSKFIDAVNASGAASASD